VGKLWPSESAQAARHEQVVCLRCLEIDLEHITLDVFTVRYRRRFTVVKFPKNFRQLKFTRQTFHRRIYFVMTFSDRHEGFYVRLAFMIRQNIPQMSGSKLKSEILRMPCF